MGLTPLQSNFAQCFLWGTWAMFHLHNFFVSIAYYHARQANVSNLLKIIFNFSGFVRAVLSIVYVLTTFEDNSACAIQGYIVNLSTVFFRLSLSAFLLWRVRQVEYKRSDTFIGSALLVCTAVLQFTRAFLNKIHTARGPTGYYCTGDSSDTIVNLQWTFLAIDFVIDIFVTTRLVQVLQKANTNAKYVASNMRRPHKRTLFTAVMYWNFLRLFITIFYHVMSAVYAKLIYKINGLTIMYIFTFIYISLSYLITADAEIVRVIEGRGPITSGKPEKSSFNKGNKNTHGQTSTFDISTKDSHDFTSTQLSYKPTVSQNTQDTQRIGKDTVVVSSMKRVSFFEWAKFVVGKRTDKNDKKETDNSADDSIEEIRHEVNAETDPELGLVSKPETNENLAMKSELDKNQRFSGHSLDTTVTESTISNTDINNNNESKHNSIGNAL
ncbi:9913_t:CDS:2 [Ambispora gerdemannii]|uniref:9913_t:CDS:1 n=1 Tax=Ambispora gerdemannii TaxID=144530 RepID=A0A9N9BZU3_9GLOM|nr:9913_t:CDS:2 [Ambispora gerdemannii]